MKPFLHSSHLWVKSIPAVLALIVIIIWGVETPPGLLGKTDAIGYAVCHQITERSFLIGDRPISLCARCTGMYMGALLGLIYQVRYGKKGGLPSRPILAVLAVFLAAFGVDGVNSYLHFFPSLPSLYEPNNTLRLITGTGVGIGMAAMIYPIFIQTLFVDWIEERVLANWRQMLALSLLAASLIGIVLLQVSFILYPLAILTSFTVVILLALIYTIIWSMLLKQENRFTRLQDAWWLLAAGFGTAMLQIALMDFARYQLTGSWAGFSL
ncbi:MAG: DUF2085 domain-containing protein [Chloroflexi bacterium]|nr:DUF2085 domain-containing protein [Chloroflexota bacterium]